MKFSQMPYERPAFEDVSAKLQDLLERFQTASTAEKCFAVYKEYDEYYAQVETAYALAFVRNSLDTTDEFYDGEIEYWDMTLPKLEELVQKFIAALLV